jgi:hypothetical protein
MNNQIIYNYGMDNIFDFSFMDDFTTIASLIDDGVDVSKIDYKDEDNFYNLIEKRVYTNKQLFTKFNIKKV